MGGHKYGRICRCYSKGRRRSLCKSEGAFDLADEDWDIVRKLEEAEVEAGCTDVRYSSEEVLSAMKSEIEKSMDVEGRFGDTPRVRGKN